MTERGTSWSGSIPETSATSATGTGNVKPEHNVKSPQRSWSKPSGSFLSGPSPAFVLWTRRILLAWWVALLLLEGPNFLHRLNDIRTSALPGLDRSGALEHVVADGLVELVALPALLLAMLGYGVTLDRAAVFSAAETCERTRNGT